MAKKIMHFRLKPKCGNHSQMNEKTGEIDIFTADSGELIGSVVDLCKMFPNKFEQVDVPGAVLKQTKKQKDAVQAVAEKGAEGVADPNIDDDEDEDQKPLGKDVTRNYPIAVEQDFKVFYVKFKGRWITEADDPFKALNEKPLKKDKVIPFIEDYLKE